MGGIVCVGGLLRPWRMWVTTAAPQGRATAADRDDFRYSIQVRPASPGFFKTDIFTGSKAGFHTATVLRGEIILDGGNSSFIRSLV